MGIFGKLGGNEEIKMTSQAALLVAALTMVGIDGDIDDDEVAIIKRIDGPRNTSDWDVALKTWKMKSISDCVTLVANSLNETQQLTALANLIDIAMADGILVGDEEKLLESYVEAFNIPTTEIQKIIDVISIKNDKNLFNNKEIKNGRRVCDACGKSKKLSEGKTCDKSHFICERCRYTGVWTKYRTTCPLCETKLK